MKTPLIFTLLSICLTLGSCELDVFDRDCSCDDDGYYERDDCGDWDDKDKDHWKDEDWKDKDWKDKDDCDDDDCDDMKDSDK